MPETTPEDRSMETETKVIDVFLLRFVASSTTHNKRSLVLRAKVVPVKDRTLFENTFVSALFHRIIIFGCEGC
jgi:hypothetical protein